MSPGPSEHLFPVLKFCLSEAKNPRNSGGQHERATKALLALRQNSASHRAGWESNGALLALACDIITP